jgi:hypothetical protein
MIGTDATKCKQAVLALRDCRAGALPVCLSEQVGLFADDAGPVSWQRSIPDNGLLLAFLLKLLQERAFDEFRLALGRALLAHSRRPDLRILPGTVISTSENVWVGSPWPIFGTLSAESN